MEKRLLELSNDFLHAFIELNDNRETGDDGEAYGEVGEKLYDLAREAAEVLEGREEFLETMIIQLVEQMLPPESLLGSFEDFREELHDFIKANMGVFMLENADQGEDGGNGQPYDDPFTEEEGDIGEIGVQDEMESMDAEDGNASACEPGAKDGTPGDVEGIAAKAEEEGPEEIDESGEKDQQNPLKDLTALLFPESEVIKDFKARNLTLDYYLPNDGLAFNDTSKERRVYKNFEKMACEKMDIILFKLDSTKSYNIPYLKRTIDRILQEKNFSNERVFDLFTE